MPRQGDGSNLPTSKNCMLKLFVMQITSISGLLILSVALLSSIYIFSSSKPVMQRENNYYQLEINEEYYVIHDNNRVVDTILRGRDTYLDSLILQDNQ